MLNAAQTRPPDLLKGRFRAALSFWWFAYPPRQNPAATVIERDAHALDRSQGGTLDLHEESGLLALNRAGLSEAFLKVARYEDQGDRLLDRSGHVHFEYEEAGAGARPEVDRTALRGLLLDALPPSCVRWDSVVHEVSPAGKGNWNVVVDNHNEGPHNEGPHSEGPHSEGPHSEGSHSEG